MSEEDSDGGGDPKKKHTKKLPHVLTSSCTPTPTPQPSDKPKEDTYSYL
ncbi:MAG: hypothetical protein IPP06_10200 [Saprospiraceae bacterium]|nr:hypothetical protein [Candidatus Vicinibacter affinis]